MPTIDIRNGTPEDEAALLALFDEAVAWMVARGQTGQWGDRPFSKRPETRRRVRMMAEHDGLWIAVRDGAPAGALIVGARPAHVHPIGARELYIELLINSRAQAGNDIGGGLVRHADALAAEAGVSVLRVDCWAGAPSPSAGTSARASCACAKRRTSSPARRAASPSVAAAVDS